MIELFEVTIVGLFLIFFIIKYDNVTIYTNKGRNDNQKS